ncbi:hypothetical protein PCANC_04962 [Puccinia coronata f. sp. avenae]|uniref:Reverse transcriptase Ty1/copia-type domain-containing protein n=1 Tax=Puccinia coronata f. sp. avenae TaxID=200324 RepID=A0A2N5T7M5_9BASI|nr:hypothetical protein PCANC_04962 [Puccinia coronata f. sp. avenae]
MINSHIVSWKSTKQITVSLLTTEAKYKELTDAGKEACWIINLTKEIGIHTEGINPPTICIDNQGALDLAQKSGSNEDSPHFSAPLPNAPSMGGCQVLDLTMAEPTGFEPFSQIYDELVAEAPDQASPSHDTSAQPA